MRLIRLVVLYTALALGANGAMADTAGIEALREGSMKKLNIHRAPVAVPQAALVDMEGAPTDLSAFEGKITVVNFWATWCAPCRKEMPAFEALQAEFGGDDFAVVPIATGRNPVPAIKKFFDKIGVEHLQTLRDPDMSFSREMAVLGLPVTVILDRDGQEIARMQGDAEWHSDSARAIVSALISQ